MESLKNKVDYSTSETSLLGLLPKDGKPISSDELADLHYRFYPPRPRTARQSVNSIMKSLIEKVEINCEPFQIVKANPGPVPMLYRKVKRDGKDTS